MLVSVKGNFGEMFKKNISNKYVDALVVLTNQTIKSNGLAVLPPEVYKTIPAMRGQNIRAVLATLMKTDSRHRVRKIGEVNGKFIVGFPHKNNWRDEEDTSLILRSANQLVSGINKMGWKFVAMPQPVVDNNAWRALLPQMEEIFSKTSCRIGVYGISLPSKETKKMSSYLEKSIQYVDAELDGLLD